jgi:predicted nucleic acid-binding protein
VIVLDASAAADLLVGLDVDSPLAARVRGDGDLHAPHLVDVEIAHALRWLAARGLDALLDT